MAIRHFCTVETADSFRYTQRRCGATTVTRRSLLWADPGFIQLRCRLHLGMTNADLDRNRSDRLPEDSFRSAYKGKIWILGRGVDIKDTLGRLWRGLASLVVASFCPPINVAPCPCEPSRLQC